MNIVFAFVTSTYLYNSKYLLFRTQRGGIITDSCRVCFLASVFRYTEYQLVTLLLEIEQWTADFILLVFNVDRENSHRMYCECVSPVQRFTSFTRPFPRS